MTPREFCYWLQGFFEIKGQLKGDIKEPLTPQQVTMIRDHLQYVFTHMSTEEVAKALAALQPASPFKIDPFTVTC